jgi:SAM-dependent methyltransferase
MALPTTEESRALLAHAAREGWWFRAKEDIVASLIAPHLPPDCRALVLGIGSGGTIRRIRQLVPRATVTGLDIDPDAVRLLDQIDPAGTYRVADIERDALCDASSIDLAVALDVIEHLDDDRALVERVRHALAPGGLFAVHVPAHQWLFSSHDEHLGHRRRYRPRELERLFQECGFEIVHSTPLFASTLILLAGWRKGLQPLLGLRTDRSDVSLGLPDLVDTTLYGLARIEGAVARVGLPFGSSHFLLARVPTRTDGARREPPARIRA